MLYEVVLTFSSVDETLVCDLSNESYGAVLSCGADELGSGGYFAFLSKFGYVFTLRRILKKEWSTNFF